MINSKALFTNRISAHLKESVRYLQYIFNGHIAIACTFLIAVGAIYYQQFLANMSPDFPAIWLISLVFAGVSLYNPIQNLLKEADLVFLLPAERKLQGYFNATLMYSFLTQLYLLALVAAMSAPLFRASQSDQNFSFIVFIFVFLKVWHFLTSWWVLRIRDKYYRNAERWTRFILQLLLFYFLMQGQLMVAALLTLALFSLIIFLYSYSHRHALPWDLLIEKDYRRLQAFYRLASLFTDVPQFKSTVKKRRLLVMSLTKMIAFRQNNVYTYLLRITFARAGDYLGIYLRLMLVGGLALYYIQHLTLAMLVTILFLYLTALQLLGLWYHHRTTLWLDLYPAPKQLRERALIVWVEQLLLVQLFFYLVLTLLSGEVFTVIAVGIIGLVFIFGFTRLYIKNKIAPN
ncbi:ABC-2 type transport system permease protein [Amphibacillus marinus]|uniref:ABC-2 type transport system permease protein n=1 Tax=Amphibacillus marinus TaxID=872970 RepID=A0A1H8RUC0_9BACI|nr:ABC transporter permease [Amphibacillus marinus]SEO69952.1 ABC-2 type transport system permease protein [Amphibacillus marinus]